jgi:hypothetical protein
MEPKRSIKKTRGATLVAAGVLAFAGLMTTGVGIANAERSRQRATIRLGRRVRTPAPG